VYIPPILVYNYTYTNFGVYNLTEKTMLIRHFTKPHWVMPIIESGFIQLERNNNEETCKRAIFDYYGPLMWRDKSLADIEFDNYCEKHKGNQAWFTTQRHCHTAVKGFEDCYFEFDIDEIGAVKWHYFKKQFKSPDALRVISALDRSAKMCGDDPYTYWVSETPVPVTLAKNYKSMLEKYSLCVA